MPSKLPRLSPAASRILDQRVDSIFDNLITRLLGHGFTGRNLYIATHQDLSLPGIFASSVTGEGGKLDSTLLTGIAELARDYLDKHRAQAKAQTKHVIQVLLEDLHHGRVEPDDFPNHVESTLFDVWNKVRSGVESVVETENEHAKTLGLRDGINQINENIGVDDPVVCFIPVNDDSLCDECRVIHYLPDGLTPRVFYSSEVDAGYHKRGSGKPSWNLLHPHCRCSLSTILPGFGFNDEGRVTWIGQGHDELSYQRSYKRPPKGEENRLKKLGKSEELILESLEKSLRLSLHQGDFIRELGRFGWRMQDPNLHKGMKHIVSGQCWKGFSHGDPGTLPHDTIKYYAGQMGLTVRPGPKGTARLVARKGHPHEAAYRKVQGLTEDDFR